MFPYLCNDTESKNQSQCWLSKAGYEEAVWQARQHIWCAGTWVCHICLRKMHTRGCESSEDTYPLVKWLIHWHPSVEFDLASKVRRVLIICPLPFIRPYCPLKELRMPTTLRMSRYWSQGNRIPQVGPARTSILQHDFQDVITSIYSREKRVFSSLLVFSKGFWQNTDATRHKSQAK